MSKKNLLDQGLIPEYITVEEAKKLELVESAESIKELVDSKTVKSKKLDTGEYVVDTLDLLRVINRSDKLFSKEQKQKRVNYLKDLKAGLTE